MNPHADFIPFKRQHGLKIYTDECKRASTCRMCLQPISKKTRRVVLELRPAEGQARTPLHGGKIFVERVFAHPDCFASFSTGTEDQALAIAVRCYGCLADVPVGKVYCYIGTRSTYGRLCETCQAGPQWRRCDVCFAYYPRYMTSPLVDQPHLLACDLCAEDTMKTVKNLKRFNRSQRELTARFEELRSSIEQHGAWGQTVDLPADLLRSAPWEKIDDSF